jgi:hypothetical protein
LSMVYLLGSSTSFVSITALEWLYTHVPLSPPESPIHLLSPG